MQCIVTVVKSERFVVEEWYTDICADRKERKMCGVKVRASNEVNEKKNRQRGCPASEG